MQIQAKSDHDVGKRILCNGTVYVVAPGGALCLEGQSVPADLPEADAGKLLQNARAWEPYGVARVHAARRRPEHKVQLIGKTGELLEREPPQPAEPPAAELEQEVSTVPPILPKDLPSPVAEEKEVSPSPGEVDGDPPIPGSQGEEWADPKPTYSLEWLRACAKAYQIPYGPRSKPETLCQRILAAMYGGDAQKEGKDGSA